MGKRITITPRGFSETRVEFDGVDISSMVQEVEFRHRVGDLPELRLHALAIDTSSFSVSVESARLLIGSMELTGLDLYRMRETGLTDIADRFAQAFPFLDPKAKP